MNSHKGRSLMTQRICRGPPSMCAPFVRLAEWSRMTRPVRALNSSEGSSGRNSEANSVALFLIAFESPAAHGSAIVL